MEKVANLYKGIDLYSANIDEFREQDINARVMSKQVFDRLQSNISKDKRLESLPLCCIKIKGDRKELEIISGHHRIRAARMANVTHIYSLVITEKLSKDQIKAKQLAHNALNGYDDEEVLRAIYENINDIEAKLESGVIDFENIKLQSVALQEVNFEFDTETVVILFLQSQSDKFEETVERVLKEADKVYLSDIKEFGKFKETIRKISKIKNVRSIPSILSLMCDLANEQLSEKA